MKLSAEVIILTDGTNDISFDVLDVDPVIVKVPVAKNRLNVTEIKKWGLIKNPEEGA